MKQYCKKHYTMYESSTGCLDCVVAVPQLSGSLPTLTRVDSTPITNLVPNPRPRRCYHTYIPAGLSNSLVYIEITSSGDYFLHDRDSSRSYLSKAKDFQFLKEMKWYAFNTSSYSNPEACFLDMYRVDSAFYEGRPIIQTWAENQRTWKYDKLPFSSSYSMVEPDLSNYSGFQDGYVKHNSKIYRHCVSNQVTGSIVQFKSSVTNIVTCLRNHC